MIHKLKDLLLDSGFSAIVLLSSILLFQNIWIPGFFQDGYIYAAFGKNAANDGHWLIPHLSPFLYKEFFQHQPLTFILEGLFFKIVPPGYASARFFGLMFPLATLVIMYQWLKKENKNWAFFSCLLLLLIPAFLKKSRFPNTDTPMMFSFFMFSMLYWKAYTTDKLKYWLGAGFFFGCAILIKGPFGMFLPGIVFLHQIFAAKGRDLLKWKSWASLGMGAFIFCLWPLSLKLIGRYDAFETWIDSTFFHNVMNRRDFKGTHSYDYLLFMIKQLPHLTVLYFIALWKYGKDQKKLPGFMILFFGMYIFLISLPAVKYSNYMMMSYPFIAISAGWFLADKLGDKSRAWIPWVRNFAIVATLVFAIFPVAKKIRRDPEIYKLLELTRAMQNPPKVWLNTDGVYPYYAMANLLSFEGDAHVYGITSDKVANIVSNQSLSFQNEFKDSFAFPENSWMFLIRPEAYNAMAEEVKNKVRILAHFKKHNFYALIPDNQQNTVPVLSF